MSVLMLCNADCCISHGSFQCRQSSGQFLHIRKSVILVFCSFGLYHDYLGSSHKVPRHRLPQSTSIIPPLHCICSFSFSSSFSWFHLPDSSLKNNVGISIKDFIHIGTIFLNSSVYSQIYVFIQKKNGRSSNIMLMNSLPASNRLLTKTATVTCIN